MYVRMHRNFPINPVNELWSTNILQIWWHRIGYVKWKLYKELQPANKPSTRKTDYSAIIWVWKWGSAMSEHEWVIRLWKHYGKGRDVNRTDNSAMWKSGNNITVVQCGQWKRNQGKVEVKSFPLVSRLGRQQLQVTVLGAVHHSIDPPLFGWM